MTKQTKNVKKSNPSAKSKKVTKVSTKSSKTLKKTTAKQGENKTFKFFKRVNPRVALAVIFLCAVLLIFASYAWFSTNLNIKIKTLNMVISRNSDITISIDGVNFDRSIEINKEIIYEKLGELYANHNTQWPSNGLIPVSSPGIPNSNTHLFDMFETNILKYKVR